VKDRLLSSRDEVFSLLLEANIGSLEVKRVKLHFANSVLRPLLIGISAASTGESLLIMGGSAVCFSFGTFWNKGIYSLRQQDAMSASNEELWSYTHTVGSSPTTFKPGASSASTINSAPIFTEVRRVKVNEPRAFDTILKTGIPVVLEDLDLGSCIDEWTLQGLKTRIGHDRQVSELPKYYISKTH
jgi:tRNA wybutosine-synthesizing protein 4